MAAVERSGRDTAAGSSRPAARPSTHASRHHLEPNPFEQSFSSKPSSGRSVSPESGKPEWDGARKLARKTTRSDSGLDDGETRGDGSSSQADSSKKSSGGPSTPGSSISKRTLPPIASIASPNSHENSVQYPWGSSLNGSLRAGPLSPAMLAGPQNFDPTAFRTGLTPDLSTFKTGLTPLGTAGGSYPPPSPNTAAFLAMVTNASGSAITPNTLSALSGNPIDVHASNASLLASQQGMNGQDVGNKITQQGFTANNRPDGEEHKGQHRGSSPKGKNGLHNNGNGPTQAASGLFLLSQAHQELAKRGEGDDGQQNTFNNGEMPDAKSLYSNVPNGNHTVKHAKNPASNKSQHRLQDVYQGQPKNGKRKNGLQADGSKAQQKRTKGAAKGAEMSPSAESDELLDESTFDTSANGGPHDYSGEAGADEDEKRRNFLERNRQAALKCRQRKKAWLASLQAKVEYLQSDNEHLQGSIGALRNEVMFLKSQLLQAQRQLAAHGVGQQPDQMTRHSVSGPMGIPTSNMMPQAMTQVSHNNIHAMAAAAAAAAAVNPGAPNMMGGSAPFPQQLQHIPRPTQMPLHAATAPFGGPPVNKQPTRQGSIQAV